jgi:hypothetical protein
MSKHQQILDVAMELLSEKEKYTPQGDKPYVTAREVFENVEGSSMVEVQDVLLGELTANLVTIEVGADKIREIRYTV